jgi:hypothetical protein
MELGTSNSISLEVTTKTSARPNIKYDVQQVALFTALTCRTAVIMYVHINRLIYDGKQQCMWVRVRHWLAAACVELHAESGLD